ncbi:unnamed protein product [Alopecurus aequalis]
MAPILFLVLAVSVFAPASCKHLPVVVPVTKDTATSLYTIPFNDGANLVCDIGGPLVWSTCTLPSEFPCESDTCGLANAYPVPGCPAAGCGHEVKTCTAYPYNPVTGACAAGSLVHTRFVANTTDGNHTVSQVSVKAVSACGTRELLGSLPRSATGVVGLADSRLALPAQVASSQKVAKTFFLCLSGGGDFGDGVAIFGGGPFQLPPRPGTDYRQFLDYTPLLTKHDNPAHYVSVKHIELENSIVPLPPRALATGGVVLSTTVPYTLLRADVYRPFLAGFRKAMPAVWQNAREVKPVAPFGLCYDLGTLIALRSGLDVPSVTLALDGGKNWTMLGDNSMVRLEDQKTACLAFVQADGVKAGDGKAPAVIVGGFQMENFLLQFDLEKKQLGFFRLEFFEHCGSFDFSRRG